VRDADQLPDSIPLPFRDPAEGDELRARLAEALKALTDRQRSVLVLHDVEGFTHGEIGSMLGIPEGTARSDLHHARTALRKLLEDIRSE
jgi:RNA polymerase sigma-70 factor (ECF subfamily)